MLTNSTTLKQKIDSLWDKFWSGGISNPLTAIEQMSYLIFLKRLEDNDNSNAAMAKRRNEKFTSVFKGNEECRWSYWSQLPGEQMIAQVRDKVFNFLRNLGGETSSFTQHMKDAVFIIPRASLLQEAVNIIEDLHITEQNVDVQGDLYEYLLMQLTTAGKNGQFRTPRHIIRMMVKLVDPKIGDMICDPACGTAGFLFNSYMHILEQNTSKDVLEYDEEGMPHHLIGDKVTDKKLFKFLKTHALTGYDFDSTMTRIGAMNLMLHGIDNPNIRYTDSLSKAYNEKEMYDVVLANPPFKGSIDETDVNQRFKTKTKKTELLFVELIYDLLVTGGRAAVIVPDGVLFGTSNAHIDVRKNLIDKCKLEGIISMPSGVFKPYAGVSTAVVIFQKGGITDKVWFYDMEADGFTLDDKRNKTDKNDIPDIIAKWKKKEVSKKSLMVNVKDIKENKYDLSISRYKPIEYEEVKYEKPDVIMEKVLKYETEIAKDISEDKEIFEEMKTNSNDWQIKPLGEVVNISKGKKLNSLVENKTAKSIRFIQIDDLRNNEGLKYTEDKSGILVNEKDVLIAWDGANAGTVGFGLSGYIGSTIARLELLGENIFTNYFGWYLRTKSKYLRDNCTGATIPHINKSVLESLKIPLPPLPIQKEIAEILEKADEAKQKREEANKLTDEFLQSVFIEMFGDPVKNPKGWGIYPLTEMCLEIIDCPHSTPIHSNSITEYPCIRTTEMKNGYIDWTSMKYLDLEQYTLRIRRLEPKEGDIIFAREGIFGEAIRVPPRTKISLGQRTLLFRPNNKKIISEYLWAFVRSQGFYQQAIARNSGSTVAHINVKDIRNFGISLPPLSLQQQFAEIVNKTEALKEKQKQSEQELENLFQSLMQKAFKGELVS